MQIFWARSETAQEFWGPYTEQPLAERVRKIACMSGYEDAEVSVMELDEHSQQILSGLLPWKIVAELEDGHLQRTTCSLTWPPEVQEGIVRGEAEDGSDEASRVEYFVWAKTEAEAKRRIASLGAAEKQEAARA